MTDMDQYNLDMIADDGVTLNMRPKDASFRTLRIPFVMRDDFNFTDYPDHAWEWTYVDAEWGPAPVFRQGMTCPNSPVDNGHVIGTDDDCDVCHETDEGTVCSHIATVCAECIESWSMDYFFTIQITLAHGAKSDVFGLNDAPGYPQL